MGRLLVLFLVSVVNQVVEPIASAYGATAINTTSPTAETVSPRPASVSDAIEMTRIQYRATGRGEVAAISPDQRYAAIVTWRGDLTANTNLYTLSLVNMSKAEKPRDLFTVAFTGDPTDDDATAIANVTFSNDGRRIAFLGRRNNEPEQVYIAEIRSGRVEQLTSHRTAVRSFIVDGQGRLRAFSAVGQVDEAGRQARLDQDGVFAADQSVFPFPSLFAIGIAPLLEKNADAPREYFITGRPKPFFDSRVSRWKVGPTDDPLTLEHDIILKGFAQFTGDPAGRQALLHPYARATHPMQAERYAYYKGRNRYEHQIAAPYGVVDLRTGKVEVLLDAPSPPFAIGRGPAFWSPDSRSVVFFTLNSAKPDQPPGWVEMDLRSRRYVSIAAPQGWSAEGFLERGQAILLRKGDEFASVRRTSNGEWGDFRTIGSTTRFNDLWSIATDGTTALGVIDAPDKPPELAALGLRSGAVTQLTNLNPWISDRQLGEVEELTLNKDGEISSEGFLIKPVGYVRSKKYPLVYLFDDGTLGRHRQPFLFDAFNQLNGHAVQMLAAQGFMVFYSREPSMENVVETAAEGPVITRHVETVLAELDQRGLIDLRRVGISGWSRAGYYVNFVLMNATTRFAAASVMDGGGREYNEGIRPFFDLELAKIKTPLLAESYGITSLVGWGGMADRMRANGQPTETLYYKTASHSTVRPKHRLRSLQTHIDWWRFWLKGEEQSGALSADQYPRWRDMKAAQCARLTGGDKPWYCEQ